jgi:23S rRNA (guanosine2251-2'-O)-methyltransferase
VSAQTLNVHGLHAVRATLAHAPLAVLEAWIRYGDTGAGLQELESGLRELGVPVQRVAVETLDRLAAGGTHQGIVLRRRPPAMQTLEDWLAMRVAGRPLPLAIVVDQLQDPHNLGALLRLADATGADGLILTRDRSSPLTAAAAKVASGALDTVPLVGVTNLARALLHMKAAGMWVAGTAMEAPTSLFDADLVRPLAWVLGAEGSGMRRLTRESCDLEVYLPMRGSVASLNLATAAAVCLYETLRQRGVR